MLELSQQRLGSAHLGFTTTNPLMRDVGNEVAESLQVQTEYINTIVLDQMEMDTCFNLRPWLGLPELE